jgi:hypothetical protein
VEENNLKINEKKVAKIVARIRKSCNFAAVFAPTEEGMERRGGRVL